MAITCSNCGEELLGAVNICWRCGQEQSARGSTAALPAPGSASSTNVVEAVPVELANLEGSLPHVQLPEVARADQGAHSDGASSLASTTLPTSINTDRAVGHPRHTAALGGAVGALVLGALSIIGAFISLGSLITAFLGIAMGIWGLSSEKRRVAVWGLVLCAIAVVVSGFSLMVTAIDSYTGEPPLDRSMPGEDYEGELDTRLTLPSSTTVASTKTTCTNPSAAFYNLLVDRSVDRGSQGMKPQLWILAAAILGASGVGLGAYHAHGLETMLDEREPKLPRADIDKRLDNCQTAVRYQMYHALALLGLGVLSLNRQRTGFTVAGIAFVLGVVGFSGGLYLFVFSGHMIHWAIVPSGGVLLIVGWIALAVTTARMSISEKPGTGNT